MFGLFKSKPKLTPEQALAQRKKEAIFKAVQKMKPGQILTKEDMKEYIQALHDYSRWITSLYVDSSIIKFSSFELKELDLNSLIINWDEKNPRSKEDLEKTKGKIEAYKKQFRKTLWSPPIIFDPFDKKIIDGSHRALALKELGIRKVLAFEGIKYLGYDLLFSK